MEGDGFCFFFADEVLMFFFYVGGIVLDFFYTLFWRSLGVVVAAWSVFPKKNSFSLYVFFLVRNLPDTFLFFISFHEFRGDFPCSFW